MTWRSSTEFVLHIRRLSNSGELASGMQYGVAVQNLLFGSSGAGKDGIEDELELPLTVFQQIGTDLDVDEHAIGPAQTGIETVPPHRGLLDSDLLEQLIVASGGNGTQLHLLYNAFETKSIMTTTAPVYGEIPVTAPR